jgi:hypothetical protein
VSISTQNGIREGPSLPGDDDIRFGNPVKGVVDLDTVELLAVEIEHLLVWKLHRIEVAFPFFVVVAARADKRSIRARASL